jgi:hypothetical protein
VVLAVRSSADIKAADWWFGGFCRIWLLVANFMRLLRILNLGVSCNFRNFVELPQLPQISCNNGTFCDFWWLSVAGVSAAVGVALR